MNKNTLSISLIYIYIYIIMSCRWHGYLWPPLATSPYRSSPPVGLQGYIPYPHRAAEYMFELVVLLLPGHIWGSIGVHLQQCPTCLVRLTWIVFVMGVGGRIVGALWGVAAKTCLILLAAFLCNCCLASFPAVQLASK